MYCPAGKFVSPGQSDKTFFGYYKDTFNMNSSFFGPAEMSIVQKCLFCGGA